MSSPEESGSEVGGIKKVRTRSGCLNCRRKRRKCDEKKPHCSRCTRRKEPCEWGVRVTFRHENAQSIHRNHPSMVRGAARKRPKRFEILDVTNDVVRECQLTASLDLPHVDIGSSLETPCYPKEPSNRQASPRRSPHENSLLLSSFSREDELRRSSGSHGLPSARGSDDGLLFRRPAFMADVEPEHGLTPPTAQASLPQNHDTPTSQVHTENAAANLLLLQQTGGSHGPASVPSVLGNSPPPSTLIPQALEQNFSPDFGDYLFEDGIFLPGSTYLELHSTLRNHLIHEVQSNGPTRQCTPTRDTSEDDATAVQTSPFQLPMQQDAVEEDHVPPMLTSEEEYWLWKNWLEEVAPWLDKFDNDRHFQNTLPIMARSHAHLKYSILAVSALQIERKKDPTRPSPASLALYQEAIHLLLPNLASRSTEVIASCVVLCVLEMLSCSPKAWRRHLDGCAYLLQAVGMHGFSGGIEQALFWCFARMDVCGGLISSTTTLISLDNWAPSNDLFSTMNLFRSTRSFDMYANQAIFLCAHVVNLLATTSSKRNTSVFSKPSLTDETFEVRWLKLWEYINDWYLLRPDEMHPVFSIAASESSNNPFPTILFSNPPAISGNQMYHTAALLMLQHKPANIRLSPKPQSILWHARRIIAISMSNTHHGCWTNCIQPIWIAGRCMSSPNEHKAILKLMEKIEKETGWGTKWRAEDLKEWWGDL